MEVLGKREVVPNGPVMFAAIFKEVDNKSGRYVLFFKSDASGAVCINCVLARKIRTITLCLDDDEDATLADMSSELIEGSPFISLCTE